jgi:hypothetical protein
MLSTGSASENKTEKAQLHADATKESAIMSKLACFVKEPGLRRLSPDALRICY